MTKKTMKTIANKTAVLTLQDPTGKLFMLSNAVPEGDYLYLGTLLGNQIGRYKLP